MADDKFEREVIERLTRIETKQDAQSPIVAKACSDIVELQKKDLVHDAQYSLLKKIAAGTIATLGIIIPLLAYLRVI